jgi:acyl carrier protein
MEHEVATFVRQLADAGLIAQSIGVYGRYHKSDPGRIEIVEQLRALSKANTRFQIPVPKDVLPSLRSPIDTRPIAGAALHDVALESILLRECDWYGTVREALREYDDTVDIISIGGVQGTLPRSLRQYGRGSHHAAAIDYKDNDMSSKDDSPANSTPDESLSAASDFSTQPIAVIGMGCRYAQADSLEEFWSLINSGRHAATEVPANRFKSDELWRSPKGPFYGNFVSEPDAFDHRFFNISAREAASMDPQQRLLLQVAYEAMESAGSPEGAERPGEAIGCYIGCSYVEYEDNVASQDATAFSATGTIRAFVSGKVSHHFGWTGPSICFDTACSSSAVAIHQACRALQTNDCSVAIAGGVNMISSASFYQNLAAASFLNNTGASRAFDVDANGYCRGEGAGVLVLKPLRQAIKDGDRILGTVIGSAVNQGSSCTPITVPDSGSQSTLYKRTLTTSGTPASQVTYVEAHGTGTPVGDPIECASIRAAFGSPGRDAELVIGSVKDVIGHTEAASGVAGVIKTLLMMQHGSIPKQPNFTRLNPKIPALEPDKLTIASRPRAWSSSGPRTALVNNYGAAGSNAAILLEEYTAGTTAASPAVALQQNRKVEYPITLLARTEENLAAYCSRLKDYLDRHGSVTLPDLAFSLARRQNWTFDYSTSFSVCHIAALQQGLAAVASGVKPISQRNKRYSSKSKQPVVLCFGGQSGRSVYLSEDLVSYSPALKRRLDECDNACRALGLPELFPRIYNATPVEDLVQLHAMLFAIQYSSAMAWKDAGVEIACMIGHSFGQLTALAVAGYMSLDEGMSLVTKRASLMQSSWGPDTGAMLAVEGEPDVLRALLDNLENTRQAEVACYNGPNNIVLSFETAALEDVEGLCKQDLGLKTARLANSHAYHSSLTNPILEGLKHEAESINWQTPSTPVETCSAGKSWSYVSGEKIAQHTRTPVYFGEAVQRITDRLGPCMWLETGSCSPITSLIRRALPKSQPSEDTVLATMDLGRNNHWQSIAQATSALWTAGYQVNPLPLAGFPGHAFDWLDLPPYQFAKTKHWIRWQPVPQALKAVDEAPATVPSPPPQLIRRIADQNTDAVFVVDPNDKVFDLSVRGHAVVGQSLVPAGLYLELAIRAAVSVKGTGNEQVSSVQQLKIFSPLGLAVEGGLFVSLAANSQFTIFSCPIDAAGNPSEGRKRNAHASGVVLLLEESTVQNRLQTFSRLIGSSRYSDISANSTASRLSGDILYTVFSQVVRYAPYYKGLRNAVACNGEAVGDVVMPQGKEVDCLSSCISDPLALDSFVQLAGVHINFLRGDRDDRFVRVCNGIGQVAWSAAFLKASDASDDSSKAAPSKHWRLYSHMETASETTTTHDVFVLDVVTGAVVLAILGAEFVEVRMDSLQRLLSNLNKDIANPSPAIVKPRGLTAVKEPTRTVAQEQDQTPAEVAEVPHAIPSQDINAPPANGPDISQDVKDMLGDFLGLDASEIMAATDLADLGVDSLMIIELAADVRKRFDVELSTDDLNQLTDVQSLIECVGGPSQATSTTPEASTPEYSEGTRSSAEGTLVDGDAANGADDDDDGIAILASAWLARHRCSFEEDAQASGFAKFHELVYPAQAELVVAYTVEAFAALGCDLRNVRPGQRLPKPTSLPKHDNLIKQMFCILEDAGLTIMDGAGHTRANGTLPSAPAHDLHASIVQRFPQHAKEHELLRLTGARLTDCLAGRADGLKLMFGSAETRSLMEDVYTDGPMFKAATSFLARFLAESISQYRGQREIRILELGGGTGGTTVFLLKQLFENAALPKIRYTFSDISGSLVAAARKKFSHYSFLDYAIVNIEQEPGAELLGKYDIVISTNCVHATPSLSRSTRNIGKMLREDGMLCLVEHTKNLYWFDLVWGLVEGWWLFDDGRTHPLASEGRWKKDLQASGFSWVDWSDGPSEDSRTVRVIAASQTRQVLGQQTVDHLQDAVLKRALPLEETVTYKTVGPLALQADVFYPPTLQNHGTPQPVGEL